MRFLILVLMVAAPAWGASAPQRNVEIQWSDSPDAVKYIVEIRHHQGKILKTFESANPLLKFKAPIGDYEIRARVQTENQQLGQWSEWTRLLVPPKKVEWAAKGKKPAAAEPMVVTAGLETLTGGFDLSWTPEPTAKKYVMKIYDAKGLVVRELEVSKNSAHVDLPPGEYEFAVISRGVNKFDSEESRSPRKLVVAAAQLPGLEVQELPQAGHYQWKPRSGVVYRHQLERSAFMSDVWTVVMESEELKTPGSWIRAKDLKPGRYRLSLWTEAPGFKTSVPLRREFVVKPTESQLAL